MAYTGYINPEVAKMYGIPYSQLTAKQRKILHEDSLRRAQLIQEREQDVLQNGRKAFDDEARLEKVLASIYRDCQKSILADVQETIAKVQKDGGTWSYANKSALTRSRGLFEQITRELTKLGQKESAAFYEGLGNIYTDQYLRQLFTLGQFTEVKANLNRLNPALVRKTLDYPWSGAMFSDRLWNDKERLGRNLRIGLTQSMVLGEGIPEITDRINKGIDTTRYNAERVARSETKRVAYVAHDDVYEDTGVDLLEYRCANGGDSRTCSVCLAYNGKRFKRGEEPTLPIHPNCRCVYIPVVPDTFAPNELNELTESVRGAENYEKWMQENADKLNPDGTLKEGWERDWANGGTLVYKGGSQTETAKSDKDTVEVLSKKLSDIDMELDEAEKQRLQAGKVLRGLETAKEAGFEDNGAAYKAHKEASERIKELEKTKQGVYNELEEARKQAKAIQQASNQPTTLIYTTQKSFNFSDGTGAAVTKKQRDAIIATTPGGVRIVTPEKVDAKKQLLTAQKVSDILDTMPDEVKKHCKEIQLVDYYNPQDGYWGRTYKMKNFYSYATGGSGGITFYRNDTPRGSSRAVDNSDTWVTHTIAHEVGHTIDQLVASVLGKSVTRYGSDGTEYQDAISEDRKVSGESWVSWYATSSKSVHEDFADSMAEYVQNPLGFKKKFPNRYKFIEEVLKLL